MRIVQLLSSREGLISFLLSLPCILIALSGSGTLAAPDGQQIPFQTGDTVLLPATTQTVQVEGTVKFLETYV